MNAARTSSMRRGAIVALIAVIVLLTRLPFLGNGYGLHADNWRIALAARHIAQTGAYEASRLPGYPVQEYVCALFWKTGAWGFNALDAGFCALACVFFALICAEYGVEDWWLAGVALAFAPVLYVNSVSSKDFPWALALLLGSWWCAMRRWPVRTGLLLGLAMGCRITSGAAALPIALMLCDGAENRVALRRVAITGCVAAVIVIAAFVPVYARYGSDFFNFYAEHDMPDGWEILRRMTMEVWDVLGLAGVVIAAGAGIVFKKHVAGERGAISSRQILAWVSMVVIYVIAFLCLPDEAAYLIPAVPFILLLAWRFTPRWGFAVCCALVIASPFLSLRMPASGVDQVSQDQQNGVLPQFIKAGLILQDRRDRIATDGNIADFLQFTKTVPGRNAYITGSWQPPIDVMTADTPHPDTKYIYLATEGELDALVAQGWHVWYLDMMRLFEARVYHYDVAAHGARDARELERERAR